MTHSVKFVIVCSLIGYFLTNERLFKPLREWASKKSRELGKFVSCPKCVTFWVASGMYVLDMFFPVAVNVMFPILISCILAYAIETFFDYLEKR